MTLLAITAVLAAFTTDVFATEPGPDDVIVLFRAQARAADRDRVLSRAGGIATRRFHHVSALAATVDSRGRALLERHPDVVAVIPDRVVEALGKPTGGGGGTAVQVIPAGVARIAAGPGATSYTGAGIGVAIVDSGVDFQHPDLTVASACFTAYSSCQDDQGHGTHVAGIVAARNNTIDVVGVAPGATVYAVKVLNARGRGSDSAIMAGLDWILDNAQLVSPPIRVVNMSLGRSGSLGDNPALHAAVAALYDAGIVVVVAAGNDATLQVSQQVPATYPEVLAIASTTAGTGTSACSGHPAPVARDTASYFTTDGAYNPTTGIGVSVSAPGEDAETISKACALKSTGILSTKLGGGTVRFSGTSMAAPHVAGVVALMVEQAVGSAVAPEDARRRLRLGSDASGVAPLNSPSTGYTFDGEREGVLYAPGALATP